MILSDPTSRLNRFITVGIINKVPSSIICKSKNDVSLNILFSSIKNEAPSINNNSTTYLNITLKKALIFDIAKPSPLWPMKIFIILFPGVACQDDEIHNISNIAVNMIGMNMVMIRNSISNRVRVDEGACG